MRSGRKTGLWYDEFAIPYSVFKSHALDITVASPLGGRAPIDRQSLSESQGEILAANQALENTVPLASLSPQLFDAIYLPGGNGTMYDLPKDTVLIDILQTHINAGRLLASLCHGAVCLSSVTQNGAAFTKNRAMTCFSNTEEQLAGATDEYDFLLENKLREQGAKLSFTQPWTENVVIDDKLITGQNPQSSERLAKVLVDSLF